MGEAASPLSLEGEGEGAPVPSPSTGEGPRQAIKEPSVNNPPTRNAALLALAAAALAALLGCAQPAATPTPTATPAPAAAPAPTATPTATPAPTPTAAPTATPTPVPPELELGAPAPDFDVTLFDGGQMRLSDLAGQVVVLNFWASWCPPCREEMPSFEQAWLAARDDGVVFVGLATGDIEADARAFADHVGVTYPLGLDLDGAVADRYFIRVMPTTYFIDREGLLQRKLSGYVNQGVLKVFLAGQTGQ